MPQRWYQICRILIVPFIWIKFRPIVLHKDRIIQNEKVIYAPNHRSTLDPMAILFANSRFTHWAALKRFFDAEDSLFMNNKNKILCKITSFALYKIEAVPIDREKSNLDSIKNMMRYLKKGDAIGIFPEGTTNKNPAERELLPIHEGMAALAKHMKDCYIQPISLIWQNGRVGVSFGQAFSAKNMTTDDVVAEWEQEILEGIHEIRCELHLT